jgi:ketosteroid isomerase-like protein
VPTSLVSRFISALEALEQSGDESDLVALLEEGATLTNSASPRVFAGRDGAAEFWRSYRGTFGDIRSEFTQVIESGALAALEWTARGTLASGEPAEYGGVTLLEIDDEGIRAFRAYFTPLDLPRTAKKGTTGEPRAKQQKPTASEEGDAKDVQLEQAANHDGNAPTDPSYASPGRTT